MQQLQTPVRLFQGENRLVADVAMGDNVSPDALNCDYSKGTIAKRLGISRVFPNAMLTGGLFIRNTSSNSCVWFPNKNATASVPCIVQFVVQWWGGTGPILSMYESGVGGWEIRVDATNGFQFNYKDTAGPTRTVNSGVIPVAKGIYYVTFRLRSIDATDPGTTAYFVINGVTYGSVDATLWTEPAATTRPLFIGAENGATPQNATVSFVIDDLRIFASHPDPATVDLDQKVECDSSISQSPFRYIYWKFNESGGNFTSYSLNEAAYKQVGFLYDAGPTPVAGIVPVAGEDNYALRFDGIDDRAAAPYSAALAPITDTGTEWTVEGWARLDVAEQFLGAEATILQIGADGADCAIWVGFSTAGDASVYYGVSTSTTSFTKYDSGYDAVQGTAFHFGIIRNGTSLKFYINGVLQDSQTIAASAGPSSSTSYGVYFGARNESGSYTAGTYCPVTIDEVRVWTWARTEPQLLDWYASEYSGAYPDVLIHNWQFNADNLYGDMRQNADVVPNSDGYKPTWSVGLVYSSEPQRLLMLATAQRVIPGFDVGEGKTLTRSEIVIAGRTTLYTQRGDELEGTKTFSSPVGDALLSWTTFRSYLIFTSHAFLPQKWRSDLIATNLTISDQPTAPSGVASATVGNPNGDYTYRVSFRNSTDGTESLASDASATVTTASKKVDLSSIDTSADNQVDQRRIWRKKSTESLYRLLTTIEDNTTTTYTDDTSDAAIANNTVLNTNRGTIEPAAVCCVYSNRLWLGNTSEGTSTLRYSEADTIDFPASNAIDINPDDGDEITGLLAAYGGMVIFKNRSIYFMTGYGPTTFQIQKVWDGAGCVAHKTITQANGVVRFLGIEGVYEMDSSMTPRNISQAQQTLLRYLDTDKTRYATAAYHPSKRQYYISFDTIDNDIAYGRYTLVYNEIFESWALWDIGFDVLELRPTDANEYRLLGLRDGFCWTIEESESDGGDVATAAELTGTSTGSGAHYIDDSGAAWPTTHNGLAGCYVDWEQSAGNWQRYRILGNTATRLYVHADLSAVASRAGAYVIAGIDWHWQSRYMDMGNPGSAKRYFSLSTWQAQQSGSNTITLRHRTETNEAWTSTTLATSDEFARIDLPNRGRAIQIEFSDESPNKPAEIEGFQVAFAERRFI